MFISGYSIHFKLKSACCCVAGVMNSLTAQIPCIQLSYVKCPRMLPGSLIALNTIMFLIVATAGHLPIYYRSVSFEIIDGVARLTKVYGPLHDLYKVFIFGYLGAIIAIICYTAIKKLPYPSCTLHFWQLFYVETLRYG